jgi:PAS domain S-box-containing protein
VPELQRVGVAVFYFDPNDRKTVLDRLVNTGSVRNFDVRMKKLDGSIIWASITATLKFDEGGRPLWIDGIVEDISDRRRAEEALRESEDRLRTLINAMPDIVCLKDGEGHWLEANDYDIDFFGLRGVDYRGKTDADLAELSPLFREAFLNCVESDEVAWAARAPVRSDEEVILPGGGAMIFDIIKVPMFYRDGRRRGLIVVGRDITGRRSVEDTLRKSLGEKEVLLKEIHHRVKNNLNIIVSLLSMQAEKEKNARARDSLTMTRTRIFAIAQIHELLYQMDNLALIDFRAYIEKMISRLHALYVMAPKRVREVLDVRDVMLDVNHAVPCGVLINEILTNSYKHAFEERDEGEISVTFYREGDVFRLIIADNGRGLAGDFSRETHGSLGLDLIHVLAENQLKGTMIVSSANGLRYEIEIPAPAVKNGMQ